MSNSSGEWKRDTWPEVKEGLRRVGVQGMQIYRTGNRLFMVIQTTDEFDPGWTFAGTVQEATVAYELGRTLANDGSWPGWYPGVEYGAIRVSSDAERTSAK